jgi:hypothetical protein
VIGKHVTNTNANNLGTGTKLYAHVLTTTTFSLFTDAALTAGVAGNGVGGATGGVISLTRDTFFNPAVSTAGVVVAAGVTITSPTSTLGVADGADITWTAVSGAQCEIVLVYKDTGTATTSPLIAYIDQATNLPVTPNGGNITVTWDNTANRIFVL